MLWSEAQIQSDEMDENYYRSVADAPTYENLQITSICYAMIETLSMIECGLNPAY